METVGSRDGTRIAFDRLGQGPALILVGGALSDRSGAVTLARALAPHLTVYAYDRRGRGDSGDEAVDEPHGLAREIEDLDALFRVAGGEAFAYGHSSGAALALEAAAHGLPITRLALYEPPYIVNGDRPPLPDDFVETLRALRREGRREDAVEYFFRDAMLLPPETIAAMRQMPMWSGFVANAHTLAYDGEAVGDHMAGKPLPGGWAEQVTIPTLVIDGGASAASLRDAAAAVAALLPNAQRRTLEGQGHSASPAVLAPVLEAFLLA